MKILFVVTAFYPEQAIGSVRITKFVKYLERAGDDVTVLSLAPAPWAARDESLWFSALETMHWKSIDQSLLFRRFLQKARVAAIGSQSAVGAVASEKSSRGFTSWVKRTAQFGYTLVKALDWVVQVRRYVARNMAHEKFDVIFTSYPSIASPLCGLMLKRMRVSDSVVVDFRDPITYGKSSRIDIKGMIQKKFLDMASLRVFASEGVKGMVSGKKMVIGGVRSDLVLNNGFDPEDRSFFEDYSSQGSKVFKIVYTGSLYGGKREVSPVFAAIKSILEKRGWPRERIELHYAGYEGALFLDQASKWELGPSVVDHGVVSRWEAVALQKSSDLCLLATWNTREDQGILTGKVFEFFMLRKPVLGVVSGDLSGSEIKGVINDVGAGFCYEISDPSHFSEMIDWLGKVMEEKFSNGYVEDRYKDTVNKFGYEESVCRLRGRLRAIVGAETGA
ncbi:hypothetical protein [Marinobacter litoralis]|uniref:hypothetical protein n=1 Tax=Marinobacter litoralis TaxID=187981 RepID=UPI0018EE03E3|nr:hypothetical protein [Marinobacter litoralis]MBJ6137339.1 hypothetical protein [Marinobacter litoralis]